MVKKCMLYALVGLLGMQPYMIHAAGEAAAVQAAANVGYVATAFAAIKTVAGEGKKVVQPLGSTAVNLLRAGKNVALAGGHICLLTAKLGVNCIIAFSKVCEGVSEFVVDHPGPAAGFLMGLAVYYAAQKCSDWSRKKFKEQQEKKRQEFERKEEERKRKWREDLRAASRGEFPALPAWHVGGLPVPVGDRDVVMGY